MKVKELFVNKAIDPRWVARKLDVSTQSIYQTLERDIERCELRTIRKIARAVNCTLDLRLR